MRDLMIWLLLVFLGAIVLDLSRERSQAFRIAEEPEQVLGLS
jgi:hypothetical protein